MREGIPAVTNVAAIFTAIFIDTLAPPLLRDRRPTPRTVSLGNGGLEGNACLSHYSTGIRDFLIFFFH